MRIKTIDGYKIYRNFISGYEYPEKNFEFARNLIKNDNEILFRNLHDLELFLEKGYCIQYSASDKRSFAFPYHSRFRINNFKYKDDFKYDFSFVGGSTHPVRERMINNVKLYDKDINCMLELYEGYFKSNDHNIEERKKSFKEIIEDTKFSLCPRGYGLQSIRFFESLSLNTVPVYIGNKETKFPLDWLIDWDSITYRFDSDKIDTPLFYTFLDNLMNLSIEEINEKREKISKANRRLFEYKYNEEKYMKEIVDFIKRNSIEVEDKVMESEIIPEIMIDIVEVEKKVDTRLSLVDKKTKLIYNGQKQVIDNNENRRI